MKVIGSWEIEWQPQDGGRISRLRYSGCDLLTRPPSHFEAPKGDFGAYEKRPVYGYDDCFPTVSPCGEWPDHGELCWLPWEGEELRASIRSRLAPVMFERKLEPSSESLLWSFRAVSESDEPFFFQHVMHPLVPLKALTRLELPACSNHDSATLDSSLLTSPRGQVEMFYLQHIESGRALWEYRDGPAIQLEFDPQLFPTLGIWWNRDGYPDEDGCRRNEAAFEPVPGVDSTLSKGTTMSLPPRSAMEWSMTWRIV